MTNEIILEGCAPAPLALYLKALAVLRLVSEQTDPDAAGRWAGEWFVLRTRLDSQQLMEFFLEHYSPTPLVSPWNGGSGFYFNEEKLNEKDPETGKKKKTGRFNEETEATRTVDAFAASKAQRLARYRDTIRFSRNLIGEMGLVKKPENVEKQLLLERFRAMAPESALLCMDSGICLTDNGPKMVPLLGSGWNDGNLEFTSNFMQRIALLMDLDTGEPTGHSRPWLSAALFGHTTAGLMSVSIGQFFPGCAGDVNAGLGYTGDGMVNPWDFVLLLEGAVVLSTSATRRLESGDSGSVAFPFSVKPTASGTGTAVIGDEEESRGEIWLPLWNRFAQLDEISALFSEGRATLGRASAVNSLDFARAVASFGVDRGIVEFQRYGFLKHFGKSYFATPLSRVHVKRNPDVDLIRDLDRFGWLGQLRRFARKKETPGRIAALIRRLEDAIFSLVQKGGRGAVQEALCLLGEIQQAVSLSAKARESILNPLPRLSEAWDHAADDGSDEYRIARALAGIYGPDMMVHWAGVKLAKGKPAWDEESKLAVWGTGTLGDNLARVAQRRVIEAARWDMEDKPFESSTFTGTKQVLNFLNKTTDDHKIARLIGGLCHVRLSHASVREPSSSTVLPIGYQCLKLLLTPNRILKKTNLMPEHGHLPLPGEIIHLLANGTYDQIQKAVDLAWHRLVIAGMTSGLPSVNPFQVPAVDGKRLLAALIIPIGCRDIAQIGKRIRFDSQP